MSIEKQPTFATLQNSGIPLKEIENQGLLQDEAFNPQWKKNAAWWVVFWSILTLVSITAVILFYGKGVEFWFSRNRMGQLIEETGFVLFFISGLFSLGSFMAGTQFMFPPMAYSSGSGAIQAEQIAREQMFSRYQGPIIGFIFAILFYVVGYFV